jgi:antitoxin component of RelBE/YafQ-DinJ toxin-antitoxin module
MGKTRSKSDRIYLRIDPKLKEKVQRYCDRKHTTISDVVNRFFVRLLEEEAARRQPPDAEQI